jgi:hypothetical protein
MKEEREEKDRASAKSNPVDFLAVEELPVFSFADDQSPADIRNNCHKGVWQRK